MTDLAIQEIARAMFDAVKPNRDFGFDDIEPIKQAYMTGAQAAYAVARKHIEAWQPIETAPKDGRKALLCQIVDGEYKQWPETFYWEQGAWYSAIDGTSLTVSHTHWRPIPDAPTSQEEQS